MKHRRWIAGLICAVACVGGSTATAERPRGNRGVIVEDIRNDQSSFLVRVDVDKPDRVYSVGETMRVSVVSEKPGYLYLIYLQADDKAVVLFPNKVQQDNRIPAGMPIKVPADGDSFRLRISEPVGRELLKAIVSLEPLKELNPDQFKKSNATPIDLSVIKKACQVEEVQGKPEGWAEHNVEIITVLPGGPPVTKHRRIAVCIGISDFQDSQIPKLLVSHRDAEVMAEMLKTKGEFQEVIVLTNQQATRNAIENCIRRELSEKTRPGDEIVIFWSGHGGRLADDSGDEKDGYDEMLIPYDANVTNIDTMRKTTVVDDAFGRWLQELDGRKVLVVLDACHSGGQAAAAKALKGRAKGLGVKGQSKAIGTAKFDFLDREISRCKDLGQKNLSLLASSTPDQVSFERNEGDLSVMTFVIVDTVAKASGSVSLESLFEKLKVDVPAYVQQTHPGATQTPVLVDEIRPFYVKP